MSDNEIIHFFSSLLAHQPPHGLYATNPGFFMGLLHGFIAPLALIGSFFIDIRVYTFPNAGLWYDLGFVLGITRWGRIV